MDMRGKIGLEEHFAIPETLDDSRGFFPDRIWAELKDRLLDLHGRRLRLMDEHGIEMMLLSLNAPVVQAIPDPARANDIARPRPVPGTCRAADAGSGPGGAGA
jgi:2,3-dihydroxybenzoate decarboxylase